MSQTLQSTEAYPVLAVYGAVLKELRTLLLLLVAAGLRMEPGHRTILIKFVLVKFVQAM